MKKTGTRRRQKNFTQKIKNWDLLCPCSSLSAAEVIKSLKLEWLKYVAHWGRRDMQRILTEKLSKRRPRRKSDHRWGL
jgi:hypothetical protein